MAKRNFSMTEESVMEYKKFMVENEKSSLTIEKYIRDIRGFLIWNAGKPLERQSILNWKTYLGANYAISSANSMIAALNGYLDFLGCPEFKVKPFRQQKKIYRDGNQDMSESEYRKLLKEAEKQGDERLKLVMKTICSTGIRVSELVYITAEAVEEGRARVSCKNKDRIIFIPRKLQQILKNYMKKCQTQSGPVFRTRNGNPLNRTNIWSAMKKLCEKAGVDSRKVYPHNLRHLFAKAFYKAGKDMAKLADVLGHSNIETTRIYLMENGREHERLVEELNLLEEQDFYKKINRKEKRRQKRKCRRAEKRMRGKTYRRWEMELM